jgi:electron transport complex protein RnfB
MLQLLLTSVIALATMAAAFGAILGFAAVRFRVEGNPLVDQVDALLPQTQCGQCGHPGCRPYAQAIIDGEAINHCPPGGQATINALANLLDVPAPELDEEHGEESEIATVAYIREDECIGCTKCIIACPVDAILGAAKLMHTVIVAECTGCDLCVDPCPVDCIDMIELTPAIGDRKWLTPRSTTDQLTKSAIIVTDHQSDVAA